MKISLLAIAVLAMASKEPIDCTGSKAADCSDLANSCPVGSVPSSAKDAKGTCGADLRFNPTTEEYALGGTCVTEGSCQVACIVTEHQCPCGLESITKEQVTCRQCQRCGNGLVEGVEECDLGTSNAAGAECSASCLLNGCGEGRRRCSGSHVQVCENGRWLEERDCAETDDVCAADQCSSPAEDMLEDPNVIAGCDGCSAGSCVDDACWSSACCSIGGLCNLSSGVLPAGVDCFCVDFLNGVAYPGTICGDP